MYCYKLVTFMMGEMFEPIFIFYFGLNEGEPKCRLS